MMCIGYDQSNSHIYFSTSTKRKAGPLRCCDDPTAPRVPMHTVSVQGRDDDEK